MAHWHSQNPWADRIIYLPDLIELANCIRPDGTDGSLLKHWLSYGPKLDAYILPQKSGNHSCGIRFGADSSEYLSPSINKYIAELLISKYKNAGAP